MQLMHNYACDKNNVTVKIVSQVLFCFVRASDKGRR
eukprot:COSAG02_NODE_3461_length_6697_cov_572.132161_1_plen_36_part_00